MSALTAIAIGATIIGGVTAADGAAKQGRAQYEAGMYQAQVNARNSQIAALNAKNVAEQGKAAEQDNRQQAQALRGTQRAVQAGLGQLVDTGSAGRVVSDSARAAEVDALRIRQEVARQALGFELQAQDFTTQGQLDQMGANNAFGAGKTNAFATLLGTAGQVASMSYQFNKYRTNGYTTRTSRQIFNGEL